MEAENELQRAQFERMTTEPVGKLLFMLSVPTIISMMVTNIYNLVDTAFVGTLGTSESGATGIVFGYMAILQAVAFMCGQGAGSIMSRKLGAKELEQARGEIIEAIDSLSVIAQQNVDGTAKTSAAITEMADSFQVIEDSTENLRSTADMLAQNISNFVLPDAGN